MTTEAQPIFARASRVEVYVEVGMKRTFAGAVDWPGWCRGGRDRDAALQALFGSGPRYARVLRGTRLGFREPVDASALVVVERLKGNSTTDFGSPDATPTVDAKPVADADLRRFRSLLRASWRAFDAAGEAAEGKELATGPRGGGRDLVGIVDHVLGAEEGYLSRLAWKVQDGDDETRIERTRKAVLDALEAAARGRVPERGPRGGKRWTPRTFVRRSVWHVLDHAWEIEDRVI